VRFGPLEMTANYPLQNPAAHSKIRILPGVLAQLVEHLNGIEGVRGSNPLGSRISEEILDNLEMRICSTGGARYAPGFQAKLKSRRRASAQPIP
jgi:hypothetical protein